MKWTGPRTTLVFAVFGFLIEGLLHVLFPPFTRWQDRAARRQRARPIRKRVLHQTALALASAVAVELITRISATKLDHPDEARQVLAEKVESARARTYASLSEGLPRGLRALRLVPTEVSSRERVTGPSGTAYDVHCHVAWVDGPRSPIRVKVNVEQVGTQGGIGDRFRVLRPEEPSRGQVT